MDEEYLKLKELIKDLELQKEKPTLLLHSCCGPCSSHVLKMLHKAFKITIFYYNPNIYPLEEFDKRLEYQKKIRDVIDKDIDIIAIKEDYKLYEEAIKGCENLPEGSLRCYKCYEFRLKKLKEYAEEKGFNYYSSVMSVSPYKNSIWINEILNKDVGNSKPLYSNFKKDNGYQETIKMSKEYDLYRQDYCGCKYSIIEHEERRKIS